MEASVFILKHPATKNTKLDQILNRTNFGSGNQKATKRFLVSKEGCPH